MEPSAVQFCARKISAVAGDMRKALDVCRRAVEMVEHEVKAQQVLKISSAGEIWQIQKSIFNSDLFIWKSFQAQL